MTKGPEFGLGEVVSRREIILSILERAAQDSKLLTEALSECYTLTQEEVAALICGDVKRIEGWLRKLNEQQATWLWARLNQEK